MKVKLLRDSRINHSAGEIIEVSPEQGAFLLSVGSAVAETASVEVVAEKAVKVPKATAKKVTKK